METLETLFRVEHGSPTEEELAVTAAALLAVLRARAAVAVPDGGGDGGDGAGGAAGAGGPNWFAERVHRSPRPWSSR
ncbi:hypothetical protein ACFW1A_37560 [Kitasatospora sp. NPDC058965]|uniref:hypothetical protein n=1 Tax=Kitasatospora sp. NPDC058965 TaxID=3346682 RepID=UPI0036C89AB9